MSWEPYANVNRKTSVYEKLIAMKTSHLVLLPLVMSLAPILILILIGSEGNDTPLRFILSGLIFFFWGSAGLPIMIRKEVPWLPSVRGWVAVVHGLIFLTIGWGIAAGFAILLLKSLS